MPRQVSRPSFLQYSALASSSFLATPHLRTIARFSRPTEHNRWIQPGSNAGDFLFHTPLR